MECGLPYFHDNKSIEFFLIGFGSPEGAIIIEDVIDKIAFSLSIDPAKVREINLSREGDYPHYGTKAVNEDFLIRCWNECLEQSDYWNVKKEVDAFNKINKYRKRGIAITTTKFKSMMPVTFLNQAAAYVRYCLKKLNAGQFL